MFTQTVSNQLGTLASVELADAYTDFVLSRQAMNCTPTTLEIYKHIGHIHRLIIYQDKKKGRKQNY